jgi:peptidoglycan/xylan/chitin deacetylase (PgdA/CDA1 family)
MMSSSLKHKGLALLHRAGVFALARWVRRSHAVVLTYHGVLSGNDDTYDFLNANFVAAGAFERHVAHIARVYRPIALFDLVACYERGVAPPPGSVAVTFDDGFANYGTVALPILKRYGVPSTVFLATGLIGSEGAQLWTERVKRAVYLSDLERIAFEISGRPMSFTLRSTSEREAAARSILGRLKGLSVAARGPLVEHIERTFGRKELQPDDEERYRFLNWDEVRALSADGVEFGAHTVSHSILSTLDDEQLVVEITESKRAIEAALRKDCYAFAYPNGSAADFGRRDQSALRNAGYRCAFALDGGLNGRRPDLFALRRVNISRAFDQPIFEGTISGLLGVARNLRHTVAHLPRRLGSGSHATAAQGGR